MKRALLALLMAPMVAQAQNNGFWTGNELLSRMQDEAIVARGVALGYVSGVADTLDGSAYCSPQITAGQARDVVKLFLERNPGYRHYSAAVLVGAALKEQWPCQRR
jgi:hypothetical protein